MCRCLSAAEIPRRCSVVEPHPLVELVQDHPRLEFFSAFPYFLLTTSADTAEACVTALYCKPHNRNGRICVREKEQKEIGSTRA